MPNFNDIIGQNQIRDHLKTAIEQDKVSHAYILTGDKYSGKEFIARIFAAALLCESGEECPCGKCKSCSQALSDNNPDIIFVTHEKPNVIGVDDIREQVNGDISIKPYYGKKKIYIINEAEKMNQQAQNALLKTFEEPPEYAVIMLLTTNSEEFLPTILSRAVTLSMKPVSDKLVKKYLMEEVKVPDYKADVCVAFARGNLGKAAMLATNETFDETRSNVCNLLKHIYEMDSAAILAEAKKAAEKKAELDDFFDILMVWYRDVLLLKATNNGNDLIFRDEIQYIKKVADSVSFEGIQNIINAIDVAKRRISSNVNLELTMELLLLKIQEK